MPACALVHVCTRMSAWVCECVWFWRNVCKCVCVCQFAETLIWACVTLAVLCTGLYVHDLYVFCVCLLLRVQACSYMWCGTLGCDLSPTFTAPVRAAASVGLTAMAGEARWNGQTQGGF